MEVHVFGASCPTGRYLVSKDIQDWGADVYGYSRRSIQGLGYADLAYPDKVRLQGSASRHRILISLAPIWIFVVFAEYYLSRLSAEQLRRIKIVAVSSTSAKTKKYAYNAKDKELAKRLLDAESKLLRLCRKQGVAISIVRPSLIYSGMKGYQDKNIRLLRSFLKKSPFLVFPENSGLRQPIEISQLARVIQITSQNMARQVNDDTAVVEIGGDEELTYLDMIRRIMSTESLRCKIFLVPDRVYLLMIWPSVLFPRYNEALTRVLADLSGFKRSCAITASAPMRFYGRD